MTAIPRPNPVRGWLVPSLVSVFLATALYAADPTPRKFDVPSDLAEKSLKVFSAQADTDLIFDAKIVRGVKTNPIAGEMSARSALEAMLAGTDLVVFQDPRSGALTVRRESEAEAKNVSRAIAESSTSGRPEEKSDLAENEQGEKVVKLDTFEVFGRKTLNMDIRRTEDDIQPYMVLEKDEIRRSGARDITEFLKQRIPADNVYAPPGASAMLGNAPQSANLSSVNLRGLGTNQTLILIDGRRLARYASGGRPGQPDINGIPLNAIERIEVLPTTASGIYGGGATGGVINIVLRRDYSGSEVAITYDNTFDSDSALRRVDVTAGTVFNAGRTSLLFAGSYSDSATLDAQDRDLIKRGRLQLFANNLAGYTGVFTPILGATSNIRTASPALVLKPQYGGTNLGSNITFVPYGYTGIQSDNAAALVTNAGRYNFDLANTAQRGGGGRIPYSNDPTRRSVNLTLRHEVSNRTNVFADIGVVDARTNALLNAGAATFTLQPTSTANPFQQTIQVTTPAVGTDRVLLSRHTSTRLVIGAITKLSPEWQVGTDYSWNLTRFSGSSAPTFSTAPTAPATLAITSGALNILRDTRPESDLFSPFLIPATAFPSTQTEMHDMIARVSGQAFRLPGGVAALSGLVEYQYEKFGEYLTQAATQSIFVPAQHQTVASSYWELKLPIFAPGNKVPFVRSLDGQIAVRGDAYESNGASNFNLLPLTGPVSRATKRFRALKPTIGLKWEIIAGLSLRGSYAEGFLPPSVNDLAPSTPDILDGATATGLLGTDPRRGNESLGTIRSHFGGNPALNPEESESSTIGLIYSPHFAEGLRLSVDWTRINKTGEISAILLSQNPLALELLVPGLITRAAPVAGDQFGVGVVTDVNGYALNFAKTEVESIDFALDWSRKLPIGKLSLGVNATNQRQYAVQVTAASPVDQRAGTINGAPKWKANAQLSWSIEGWTVGIASRYYDKFWLSTAHTVNANQRSATVDSSSFVDGYVAYRFASRASSRGNWLTRDLEVTVGVKNAFNANPPMLLSDTVSFFLPVENPRLASYYITFRKSL